MTSTSQHRNMTFGVGRDDEMCLNACVGNNGPVGKSGYGAGFAEAARILLDELMKDESDATIDILIYPICFSARHSIELFLKDQIERLSPLRSRSSLVTTATTHDLSNLWAEFERVAASADRRFRPLTAQLARHVDDFAAIDPTGQTFRYPNDNESKRHLVATSVINVARFKRRFDLLAALVTDFEILSDVIVEEYRGGMFTDKLSRADLRDIALKMPKRAAWDSEEFTAAKAGVIQDYSLSNKEFSAALNKIQLHREFSSLLDVIMSVDGLSPEALEKIGPIAAGNLPLEAMEIKAMIALDAAFQIGAPNYWSEDFDALAAHSGDDHHVLARSKHLFSRWNKNWQRLCSGLAKIGQPGLAKHWESLSTISQRESQGPLTETQHE